MGLGECQRPQGQQVHSAGGGDVGREAEMEEGGREHARQRHRGRCHHRRAPDAASRSRSTAQREGMANARDGSGLPKQPSNAEANDGSTHGSPCWKTVALGMGSGIRLEGDRALPICSCYSHGKHRKRLIESPAPKD